VRAFVIGLDPVLTIQFLQLSDLAPPRVMSKRSYKLSECGLPMMKTGPWDVNSNHLELWAVGRVRREGRGGTMEKEIRARSEILVTRRKRVRSSGPRLFSMLKHPNTEFVFKKYV